MESSGLNQDPHSTSSQRRTLHGYIHIGSWIQSQTLFQAFVFSVSPFWISFFSFLQLHAIIWTVEVFDPYIVTVLSLPPHILMLSCVFST